MKILLPLIIIILYTFHSNAAQTVGLFVETPASLDGYVLFAPIRSDTTYLIDKCGKKVHAWWSSKKPGLSVYLLPDGSLLRTGSVQNSTFHGNGSSGGLIERYDWNNNLTWSYTISSSTEIQNHDICPLPNGNILVAIWESMTKAQAIAAGRDTAILGNSLWSAKIEEIQPIGNNSANIIWQWRLWDHLVQDSDSTLSNYGVVANHPEILNINFNGTNTAKSLDWIHLNAVTYNADLDQVMFSSHNLSEIYIIDHSTTTAEAASHAGGIHGSGGDFLYRWGNPVAYGRGTSADRKLFQQHNPTWIPSGYKDENKIMIFNNGVNRPGGNAASVDIISQPVDSAGNYPLITGQAFGPAVTIWSYMANVPSSFFSMVMGGAQRLSNGNTLVCEATKGNFFELDTALNIAWEYVNPVDSLGPMAQTTSSTTNGVFRCTLYEQGYSAFAGHTLTPGDPIELNPLPFNCTMLNSIDERNPIQNSSFIISNPFSDKIIIRSNSDLDHLTFTLTDVTGRIVEKWDQNVLIRDNPTALLLSEKICKGIYLLNIRSFNTENTVKLICE